MATVWLSHTVFKSWLFEVALIFDEFYIWFGPYEYVEKLYNIGSLILAVGHLPKHLSSFVDEARQCYAFHQYAAVYSLCRTMLEICVRDLSIKYEIIPGDTYKVKYQRNKKSDLINLIDQLCDKIHPLGKYRDQLHNVRMKGNNIVHGNRTVPAAEEEQILRDTLSVIHNLYESVASSNA